MFDVFISIDWSASGTPSPAKPSANAIWLGYRDVGGKAYEKYFRTRYECLSFLRSTLHSAVDNSQKVMIGYDFNFGFPQGLASSMGYTDRETSWEFLWKYLHHHIEDSSDNRNNRFRVAHSINTLISNFPGPFYGTPTSQQTPNLASTGCPFPYHAPTSLLSSKRICEEATPRSQPVWKLLGIGSVGSQTLVGIPALYSLWQDILLKQHTQIWPFTTNFQFPAINSSDPLIVHCELWPSIVPSHYLKDLPIKDQSQVEAVVSWLYDMQQRNTLSDLFTPPSSLSLSDIQTICCEEGWMIGAGL